MPPKTSYTNADLRRQLMAPKDEVRDLAYWSPDDPLWAGRGRMAPQRAAEGPDPVGAAKEFLARPDITIPKPEDEAEAIRLIRAGVQEPSMREQLKGVTEAGKVGGSLGLEAVEQSPTAGTGTKLAAGFGKFFLPSYYPALAASGARQLVAPAEGESRLGGVGEMALAAAGPLARAAGRGLRALRGTPAQRAYKTAREAFESGATKAPEGHAAFEGDRTWLWKNEPMVSGRSRQRPTKFGLGHEVPYQMREPAVNPNQVLQTAREVASETGEPVESALRGYFKSAGVAKQREPIARLLQAGEQARAGAGRSRIRQELSDASNLRGRWGGDRTTGSWAVEPGQGGLADVAAGRVEPHLVPGELATVPGIDRSTSVEDLIQRLKDYVGPDFFKGGR